MATKKYLVKSIATATDENPNFKGCVHTYYNGKGDELVAVYGDEYLKLDLWDGAIESCGYNRPSDAKRCYSYTHPQNDRFWQTTVEIVEFQI